MTAPLPPTPKRILLIRLSAFGDVVIATGLLHGLKRAHPDAEIDWLVQPEFAELLRTQPAISQVMVWPRKDWRALFRGFHWIKLWLAIRAFSAALKARDYDWVIDAQGLFKSRALAKLAGGRFRIGYDGKEPGKGWLHQVVKRFPEAHAERRYIGDEHAPMLMALTKLPDPVPQLVAPVITLEAPYVVAAPFTTRPQKHWPQQHWVRLLKALADQGHRVLILGGPADEAGAQALVDAAGSSDIENRAGKTSFVSAASLIAGAAAVVGMDTGLTHLGLALGRPTLALFGSTRPYSQMREPHSQLLFLPLACAPCGRHPTCGEQWTCLAQLEPMAVFAKLNTMLT